MKYLCILSIILVMHTKSNSQHLSTGIGIESTAAGFQYVGTLTFSTNKDLGFGGFYQKSVLPSVETGLVQSFFGANLKVPMVNDKRINFYAVVRAGLVNEKFMVIVPGLETKIDITKKVGLAVGASMRMNYPAISTRLTFKVF